MPLTPQQVQAYREKYKITPNNGATSPGAPGTFGTPSAPAVSVEDRVANMKAKSLQIKDTQAPGYFQKNGGDQPNAVQKVISTVAGIGKAVIGNEINAGKDISSAIEVNYPGVQDALKNAQGANIQLGQVFQALLKKRHDLMVQGKDTSQLDTVIKEDAKTLGVTSIDNLLPEGAKKTPLQIAADFGGMALDVATAGALENAAGTSWDLVKAADKAKLAEVGVTDAAKAKTLLEHLGGTVKKIAGGAAIGYGYDVAGKVQNGETGPATFVPGAGTAVGAAIPLGGDLLAMGFGKAKGAISDVADKVKANAAGAAADKQTTNAIEAITPSTKDLSQKEYGKLLDQGRITPKTPTNPSQYILDDTEKNLAEKYKGLLQQKDPVKNIKNVVTEITNQDNEVGNFLRRESKIYIKKDLRQAIADRLSQVNDITIPKEQLAEARKDLLDTIMTRIPENNSGRTYDKLWEFRKTYDQLIKNKMNAFNGAPTLKREMSTAIRDGIQNFIASNTKDSVYATKMKDMTQLFNLRDLLKKTAVKEKGASALKVWIRSNPAKAKALEWALGGTLGYEALKGISQ